MKVGIIGGGASGMILASKINKHDVTIHERNSKLGKKLLLTGNGKCNFTNLNFDDLHDIYNNEFAINIYKKYNNISFINYFKDIGVIPKIEIHKGIKYIYPNSNKSVSVYYCLLDKIISNGVNILYNSFVDNILYYNKKFIVYANDRAYEYDKIVLSTGGMTYKNTGSDGNGYNIAKNLGHNITTTAPGLNSLVYSFNDPNNKNLILDGKCRVNASIYIQDVNNKSVFFENGEIQFSEDTISGIPILNLSRKIGRSLISNNEFKITLDFTNSFLEKFDINDSIDNNKHFMYDYNYRINIIRHFLYDRKMKTSYRNMKDFLCGFLPDEICDIILKLSGNYNKKIKELNEQDIDNIAKNIISLPVYINKSSGFDNAQITLGGIDVNSVNNDTLESRLLKGLYFMGEILDIDGKCGGYNLQLAYSTASIISDNL